VLFQYYIRHVCAKRWFVGCFVFFCYTKCCCCCCLRGRKKRTIPAIFFDVKIISGKHLCWFFSTSLYFSNFSKKQECHLLHLFFSFFHRNNSNNTISAYDCFQSFTARRRNQTNKNNNNMAQTNAHHGRKRIQYKNNNKTKSLVIEKWTTNQNNQKGTKHWARRLNISCLLHKLLTTPALFRAGEHFGRNYCNWKTDVCTRRCWALFWWFTSDIANQKSWRALSKNTHFNRTRLLHFE